jgi:hypothetical protein
MSIEHAYVPISGQRLIGQLPMSVHSIELFSVDETPEHAAFVQKLAVQRAKR